MATTRQRRAGAHPEYAVDQDGDRIYTDIRCGLNAGITTMLVLNGETTREILEASDVKPHLVLADAGEILEALQNKGE